MGGICQELASSRQSALEQITTNEGKLLRVNRSIQVEGSFAQLKSNRGFERFLMGGNGKMVTELCLLVLSQNIVRYIRKDNTGKHKKPLFLPKALLKC